ncbi:MAG: CoB--CoM heterodisulfide reductase iron-sulfur subunit B family protein [Anaerolineae bacterium]
MRYFYFTGCVTPYRCSNYDLATRQTMERLDVELVEAVDAGCCGIYIQEVDELKALALSARIWAMAEERELDILSPCPGCVSTLTTARNRLNAEPELKQKVNRILSTIGREFRGTRQVKHPLRVLEEDIGLETIAERISHPLQAEVAAHYGCHLVRPAHELLFDDPEEPQILDHLIEVTGARAVHYYDKMGCCGMNAHGNDAVRYLLSGQKLINAREAGARAVILGCPACYLALGLNQSLVEKAWRAKFALPVLHYPQLLGLALGLRPQEVGLHQNRPAVDPAIFGL